MQNNMSYPQCPTQFFRILPTGPCALAKRDAIAALLGWNDFLDHVGDQTITKVSLDLVALTVLAPDVLQALADSATLLGVSPGIRAAEETQQTDGCNHRNSGIHLCPLVGCNYRRRMIHEQLHNDIV